MATLPIVNTIDKRRGMTVALATMLLLIGYLLIATIEMADPPPKDPIVMAETIMPDEIILKDLVIEGGADSGSPTDDEVAPPTPQTQEVITSNKPSDFTEPTGSSTNTNANNQTNTSSTVTQSNDPFGSGGDNGDTGQGSTFGNSQGTGTGGDGNGSGIVRKRITTPIFDHLESSERATIVLVVTIDAQGNVVSATCNKSKTTTTNQILINRVIKEVRKQVKYNKDPGAPLTKLPLSLNITPH
jgi:hypothetical protein